MTEEHRKLVAVPSNLDRLARAAGISPSDSLYKVFGVIDWYLRQFVAQLHDIRTFVVRFKHEQDEHTIRLAQTSADATNIRYKEDLERREAALLGKIRSAIDWEITQTWERERRRSAVAPLRWLFCAGVSAILMFICSCFAYSWGVGHGVEKGQMTANDSAVAAAKLLAEYAQVAESNTRSLLQKVEAARSATDESNKAMTEWSRSPSGKAAFEISKFGYDFSLQLKCSADGWKAHQNHPLNDKQTQAYCFPFQNEGGTVFGWPIGPVRTLKK